MLIYDFEDYKLLLSHCPCEIFKHYGINEMHGLNYLDCTNHLNNTEQAYIAGWCNLEPKTNKPFVFINLSRCTDDIHTTGLVMHELSHMGFIKYNYDIEFEEEIITYAENETYKIVEIINKILNRYI